MKGRPCSEATKAKIRAAMMGNKNGIGSRRNDTVSARTLLSLRSMQENRGSRLLRYLAEHPEADAARKAKIAATRRARAAARREEKAREEAYTAALHRWWDSLPRAKRLGLAQNWSAPHDETGRKRVDP